MLSHGVSAILPNLLILAGTTEASALARAIAAKGIRAVLSFAGRVDKIAPQPLPHRIGGFGGAEALAAWIEAEEITHVIDATHPFAAEMSRNAVTACALSKRPLVALTRPAWQAQAGDHWLHVPDIAGAVAALAGPPLRVMLAVGRMNLPSFAANPQHSYLLRLVDPPQSLPFPKAEVVVARGPFDAAADRALMEVHGIQMVVSKNAGGGGAYAKIAAARSLGLKVLMIDRPALPNRVELHDIPSVLDWIDAEAHAGTDRGV